MPMLERVEGTALMQLGELDAAERALEQSIDDARARKAEFELSLALDALALLRAIRNEPKESLEAERDEILERLDVVAVPQVPIPERASLNSYPAPGASFSFSRSLTARDVGDLIPRGTGLRTK